MYISLATLSLAFEVFRSPKAPASPLTNFGAPVKAAPLPYCILPSPFLSAQAIRPVFSQFLIQLGAWAYSTLCTDLIMFRRAKEATAGAVV